MDGNSRSKKQIARDSGAGHDTSKALGQREQHRAARRERLRARFAFRLKR
jgi:hypothetical protein